MPPDFLISVRSNSDIDNKVDHVPGSSGQPVDVIDLGLTPFSRSAEILAAIDRAELVVLQKLNEARR